MGSVVYEQCHYQGGFDGMRPSTAATLELDDAQFSLRRPRGFSLKRGVHRVWAKWTAVTVLSVAEDPGGTRLSITTKSRGPGRVVLAGVTPDELWAALDGLADLKERFHDRADDGEGEEAPAADADGADGADGADPDDGADGADPDDGADPGDGADGDSEPGDG